MKIVKYILNILISFLIIFAVIAVYATNILNNKILNKNYILSKVEETEFYLQVSREVENGFENYIYQSGLPEDTIKGIFSEDMIKKDITGIIDYVYEGKESNLSSEEVKNNLDNKIQEYIKSQNLNLNEQGKNNIEKFESLIVNEYNKNVKVSDTVYNTANSIIEKLNNISSKIGNIPLIILIAFIVILILINIKDLFIAMNFLGISSLSIGVIFKLGVNLILKNIELDNLVLISTSLSNLIINILKENIYMISDNSNIFIVCGIVMICVSAIATNINNQENVKNKPKRRSIKE